MNGWIRYVKRTKVLSRVTRVNVWDRTIYMSYTSQNFRLFHVSSLSVPKLTFVSAHVTGVYECVCRLQLNAAIIRVTCDGSGRAQVVRSALGHQLWTPPPSPADRAVVGGGGVNGGRGGLPVTGTKCDTTGQVVVQLVKLAARHFRT